MSLSSLLVQREIATIRDVEEALSRQVLYGGDLATNLLEVARLDEAQLTTLLAESYGLQAAPIGELPVVPAAALALVTKDQAMEQAIVPLGLDGGTLVIAASSPLSPELEQELGFSTSRPIAIKIAPIFRIFQAIARDYGTTLPRRHVRLLARIAAGPQAAGSASALPPAAQSSATALPNKLNDSNDSAPALPRTVSSIPSPPTVIEPAIARAHEAIHQPDPVPVLEKGPEAPSEEPVPDDSIKHSDTIAVPPGPFDSTYGMVPTPTASEERLTHTALQDDDRGPPTRQSEPPLPPLAEPLPEPHVVVEALAPAPQAQTLVSMEPRAHKRVGKRRRGPLTFEVAKKEMDEASERDHVLDLFFEFSRQFFDYCAFFIVHGDAAEGRDASGQGAVRDLVAGIAVPLDAPSVLASARKALVPIFVKPDTASTETLDSVLFRDLERVGGSTVGLLPIVVRRRVVAVLLGDDGEVSVEAAGVKDATSFAALAGAAFERLIVRKKQGENKKPSMPPRSVRPDASALGRVLGAVPQARVPTFIESEPQPPLDAPPPEPALAPEVAVEPVPPLEPPAHSSDAPPTLVEAAVERRAMRAAIPREEPDPEPDSPVTPRVQSVPPEEEPRAEAGFTLSEPVMPLAGVPDVVVPLAAPLPHGMEPEGEASPEREASPEPPRVFGDEYPSSKRIVQVPMVARSEAALLASSTETPLAPEVSEAEPPVSVAVPAHLPPTRSDRPKILPSVIVDVGNEYMDLVDRVVRESDEAAETRLLHAGQHAMPAILARFPGPVRLDVSALPEGALPRAGECGPVLRLIARQRRVALPFVLTLVDDPVADRRFWATYLLSELPYVEAIEPAVLALFDAEARVRLAARTSVRVLGELYPSYTVDRLARVLAETSQVLVRRVIALQMLGEVRDPASVPHLLPRLIDPQPEISAAARASLTLVARQDFGLHLSHWNEWFDQNRGKQRAEWLIDALGHASSLLRLAALEELVKLTRNAFGYQDDMPKRERDRVMQKFRDWWAVEGRARYGR